MWNKGKQASNLWKNAQFYRNFWNVYIPCLLKLLFGFSSRPNFEWKFRIDFHVCCAYQSSSSSSGKTSSEKKSFITFLWFQVWCYAVADLNTQCCKFRKKKSRDIVLIILSQMLNSTGFLIFFSEISVYFHVWCNVFPVGKTARS